MYKDMMRSSGIRDPIVNDYTRSPSKTYNDWYYYPLAHEQDLQLPPVGSIREWEWQEPLQDILIGLRASVESYLSDSTCPVRITLPFPIS